MSKMADDFQMIMLHDNGFDTPEKRELRINVLNRLQKGASAEELNQCWKLQDGYGTPGFTPTQGFDWSGFRDSTYTAIENMAKVLRIQKEEST